MDLRSILSTNVDNLDIFAIPKPASQDHLAIYREIRLTGLFTNPEAFGSNYARESTLSNDVWMERVSGPGRATLLALPRLPFDGPNATPSQDLSSTPRPLASGTLSILAPSLLSSLATARQYPASIQSQLKAGTADVWMLVGMWVRPEARKKGVGRRLVECALEEIRVDAGTVSEMEEDIHAREKKDKLVLLQVHTNNEAARALYERAGFVCVPDAPTSESEEHDEIWMVHTLKT